MCALRVRGAAAALLLLSAGCGHKARIADLTEEFTYTVLSFSPSAATAAGLHAYKDQRLDGQLEDMGPAAIDHQARFYRDFNQRLQQIDPETLNAQDRADFSNLQDQTGLALFELAEARSYLHNPLLYVEMLGNAFYTPYLLEDAPKAERFHHIASRLRQVPLLLDQATANLGSVPGVWAKAAIEVDRGVINLVDGELRAAAPPEAQRDYTDAAGIALPAMRKFHEYLENRVQYLDNADWRLGADLYPRKFHLVLESGGQPQDLLVNAEREFTAVRRRMLELALPLHRSLFPTHKDHQELAGREREQRVTGEVLTSIAGRHSTPESFVNDALRDVGEADAFALRKHLLTRAGGGELQVAPTPEFRRTLDPVSGFQPAPALAPQLRAIYWVTPIPPDMPREMAESKLREYNYYRLKLLTLSRAIPGRYLQMLAANKVQPLPRRLLRSVFGSRAYLQGWAGYSAQAAVEEGFPDRSPEMALTFAKEQLRTLADAILDVRLHMMHMTDEEALALLKDDAFQEPEEAAVKLERAKLTSCELAGYFVGTANWIKARAEYAAVRGGSSGDFNDQALKQGAVPMSSLVSLLSR
jgi:hypothetical protein